MAGESIDTSAVDLPADTGGQVPGDSGALPAAASAVPEFDPGTYYSSLPSGINIDPAERGAYDGYAKALHEAGVGPEAFSAGLGWYQSHVANQAREIQQIDNDDRQEAIASLQAEWGDRFDGNLSLIRGFVSKLPPALQAGLANARDGTGRAVLNDPETLRYLVSLSAGSVPASQPSRQQSSQWQQPQQQQPAANVHAEIRRLEDYMRTNRRAYNRDEAAQARLRELYALRGNTVI